MGIVFLIIFLSLAGDLSAACSWEGESAASAASTSRADVADCLDDENWSNGDSLNIPGGTSSAWSTPINITNSDVSIIGAGKLTTLLTADTDGATIPDGIFIIDTDVTGVIIKNIGFAAETPIDTNVYSAAIWLNKGTTDMVVTDCAFDGFKWGIFSWHTKQVVVADNTFKNGGIQVYGDPDDLSWTSDAGLGGSDFIFIEDNTFEGDDGQAIHILMGYSFSKYVFRYNTVSSTDTSNYIADAVDAHGYGHGAGNRGRSTRAWEIYKNTFVKMGNESRALLLRGGTGVAYDNVFNEIDGGEYGYSEIYLWEYRNNTLLSNNTFSGPDNGTDCSTPVSDEYGRCDLSEGDPCCDSIGRGTLQALEPAYFWDNNKCTTSPCLDNLASVVPSVASDSVGYIDINEDYYTSEKTGYTPYTYPHPLRLSHHSIGNGIQF